MAIDNKISLDEFVHRKLQPIKVLVGMLNREMDMNPAESIELQRAEVDNLLTTLELFIEDFERVSTFTGKRMQTKSNNYVQHDSGKSKTGLKHVA